MLSLRNLAHAAAILGLAAVGLTLGLWLRDPHPGGLAFVLVFAVAVAVLLWRLYRPGGLAWAPRAESTSESKIEPQPQPQPQQPQPQPQPEPQPEPEPATPAAVSPRAPGARRIELPKGSRRIAALALGALALAVIGFIAWPDSHNAPKTAARPVTPPAARPRPAVKPQPKPAASAPHRAAPKKRSRPAPSARASARSLGSSTLQTGSKGADVRIVQKVLKVPASGKYDAKTEAAVRAFQGKHRLPTTGVVATLTHKALKKAFP